MARETINDINTARTLLKRELAIAMHLELGRGPTFTLTLEDMLDMPETLVPFAGSGAEMMDSLGQERLTRAILDKMVPKIKAYYVYDNWAEAIKQPIVYDENHVVSLAEHVTAGMFS